MHPAGNKPSLQEGVGGPACCLGLRARKHPNVSPGSSSRQQNLVIASHAGIFDGPTPHWFIPVWKEGGVFLQWAKGSRDLLSISVTSIVQH